MKAIPKRLLPNEVKYKKRVSNSRGVTYETSIPLKYVKIEENKKYYYSQNGRELISSAMLFYDLVNSDGLSEQPTVDSKIEYNDKEYKIIDVEILRDERDTPHHYEMTLK